ncbi:MAG TPA: Sapep family Mn(2+)-dependent dipeptidase [Oscillospiraceae bacterium]|nr:Sapep family Mn(2+)-dependent dipeptidase [Oscillospiraceae bacterium]
MYFGNKIDQYRDDILKDLATLIAIPSVCGEPKENMPFGEKSARALNCILQMAQNMGLETKNVGNYAGHAEYGAGEEVAAVLTHVDVVPAGSGWETAPFTMTQKGNLYFGRGTADDKGAAIVALYCLKVLKDENVKGKRRLRTIFGAGEEINSDDLKNYFKSEPMPVMGFTPDSEYGICNREKGILHLELTGDNSSSIVKRFCAGTVVNAVPDKASALITCTGEQYFQLVRESKLSKGSFVIEKNLDGAVISSKGVASHAMQPEKGLNAATYLVELLTKVFSNEDLGVFFTFLSQTIGTELNGASIGVQQSDEQSGNLTFNLGIVNTNMGSARANVDIRYPVTANGDTIIHTIQTCVEKAGLSFKVDTHNPPLFLPENSPLITLLQDSYEAVTGQKANVYATGGGTYARELHGSGVAFGPFFPDEPDRRLHNSNESIDIDRFMMHARICLEAMYRMLTE